MSIIIAIKYKDGMILAADRQSTAANIVTSHNEKKIYKSEFSNTAFGVTGPCRDSNILECNVRDLMSSIDILENKEFDRKYVINNVVNKIFNLLFELNYCYKDRKDIDSQLILASNNHCYKMFSDGSIIEGDNYVVAGCGEQLVKGYLDTLTDLNTNKLERDEAIKIAESAIKKSCKEDIYINDKIDIIVLENK